MGMHRWLLGPLICLILATTSARPPECQDPPSWSINGRQPLKETKGKASMLEELLKHFRSYGMEDLEFIIVNSKLSHSQVKLLELKKRVSFDVYQETDEEEVWSVMEGGKDDMYIYDRCGRLTYYIPFPLSILNESPLVSNAILATYFYTSPCGKTCSENGTLGIDEIVENIERNFATENGTDQDNSTDVGTEQPLYTIATSNETSNETYISNDLFDAFYSVNSDLDSLNSTNTENLTDYDYKTFDNSSFIDESKDTRIDEANTFFNSIYKLFFSRGNDTNTMIENATNISTLNVTHINDTNHKVTNNETHDEISSHNVHHHKNHDHHRQEMKEKTNRGTKKSDRCLEADFEVCKSWSKNRLLHAQKCCSEIQSDIETRDPRSCVHFGKKRCKKIQSILKCCIKTAYTEPVATTVTEESIVLIGTATEEIPTLTTEVTMVECCKSTENGKECRVSLSETCDEGEHMQKSTGDRP